MSKILLLTRHFNDNCGTVFQAYATCEILKQFGHEVVVLNLSDRNYRTEFKRLRSVLFMPSKLKFYFFRKKNLSNLTKRLSHISDINLPEADYIVIGSDQVWNNTITKDLFSDYFLANVSDKYKKISLASSFATEKWNATEVQTLIAKENLKKFDKVSVREKSGVKICKNTFDVNAELLIDPTLALGDFTKFLQSWPEREEVLFYSFKPKGYIRDIVKDICKRCNLKPRSMKAIGRKDRKQILVANPMTQGPIEWLNYIASSKIIVTDSFHGIVFSLLTHRQFVALRAHEDRFERIQSLLNIIGLENRIALSYKDFVENYEKIMSKIDYKKVDAIIQEKRLEFYAYIKQNIK